MALSPKLTSGLQCMVDIRHRIQAIVQVIINHSSAESHNTSMLGSIFKET